MRRALELIYAGKFKKMEEDEWKAPLATLIASIQRREEVDDSITSRLEKEAKLEAGDQEDPRHCQV